MATKYRLPSFGLQSAVGPQTWDEIGTINNDGTALTIGGALAVTGTVTLATSMGITAGNLTLTSGNLSLLSGTATIKSANASAFAVGLNGATTPAFVVDASTGSQAAGLKVTGAAANGNVAIASSQASGNNNLTVDAMGTGTVTLNGTATGNVIVGSALAFGTDASAAKSIVAGTTNGLKIGTAASQKLGFFNATPVVQQTKAGHNNWTAIADVTAALANLGLVDTA